MRFAWALAPIICLCAVGAFADPMTDAAKAGREAATPLVLAPGSSVFSEETIGKTVIPFATDAPPESAITGTTIENQARLHAAGSSTEAGALQSETTATTSNPRRDIPTTDPGLQRADGALTGADAIAGGLFSASGNQGEGCTVEGLQSAGTVERSCQRVVATTTSTCELALDVAVTRTSHFECDEAGGTHDCAALASSQSCHETGSTCLNLGTDGTCLAARKRFDCTDVTGDLAPARQVGETTTEIAETKLGSCDTVGASCAAGAATCTAGPETRIINGVPVTRACWAWEKPVTCQATGSQTTCGVFEADQSCHKIQSDCVARSDAGACLQWEDRYRCDGTAPPAPASCTDLQVCAGGYCETVTPEPPSTDFAESAAWLGVLGSMAKDANRDGAGQIIRIFDGTASSCRVGAIGVLNCCNDSGWGNHVLGECTEDELALADRAAMGATHYIGSYCAKRFFVCLQVKRVYCRFNSKLARVFNEQMRGQTGATWGTDRVSYHYEYQSQPNGDLVSVPVATPGTGPHCNGATVEEMEALDLEKIDLSEAFADLTADVAVPSMDIIRNFLATRL